MAGGSNISNDTDDISVNQNKDFSDLMEMTTPLASADVNGMHQHHPNHHNQHYHNASTSSRTSNYSHSQLSDCYVKKEPSGGNKSDSDSSREDGVALKNDVKLNNPSLLSPNLHQDKNVIRNTLISEMAHFSPVHIPHVDGKLDFIFFSYFYCVFFVFNKLYVFN